MFLHCKVNRVLGKDLIAKKTSFQILTPLYIILLCNRLVEHLGLPEELTALVIRVDIRLGFVKKCDSRGGRWK